MKVHAFVRLTTMGALGFRPCLSNNPAMRTLVARIPEKRHILFTSGATRLPGDSDRRLKSQLVLLKAPLPITLFKSRPA